MITSGARRGPRTWSAAESAGIGALERSAVIEDAVGRSDRGEGVEEDVHAGHLARRVLDAAEANDAGGVDDHQRALREAALVQDAERTACCALGFEVRKLRDRHAELLAERPL